MSDKKIIVEIPEDVLADLGGEGGVKEALTQASSSNPGNIRVRPTGWSCCYDPEQRPPDGRVRQAGGWC